jgi:hypothetical protein
MLSAQWRTTCCVIVFAGVVMSSSGLRTESARADEPASAGIPEVSVFKSKLDGIATCWLKASTATVDKGWSGSLGRFGRSLALKDRSWSQLSTKLSSVPAPKGSTSSSASTKPLIVGTGQFISEATTDRFKLRYDLTTDMLGNFVTMSFLLGDNLRQFTKLEVSAANARKVADATWLAAQLRRAIEATPKPRGFALTHRENCYRVPSTNGRPGGALKCEMIVNSVAEQKKLLADAQAAIDRDRDNVANNMAEIMQLIKKVYPFSDEDCVVRLGAQIR